MKGQAPSDVSGYVLAGGKSSRMGQDKALLKLAGKPLVLLAVEKLRRICGEVFILGNRPELEIYAPLVRDLHERCGPLGGIEAALSHSDKEWNLFMAVDMPFLPAGFLDGWLRSVIQQKSARVAMFTVEGRPQPALCLLHKEVAPYVRDTVGKGQFKLLQALEAAAKELAVRQEMGLEAVFLNLPWGQDIAFLGAGGRGWVPTAAQRAAQHLWFANLNTPEEFAVAEAFAGELEEQINY